MTCRRTKIFLALLLLFTGPVLWAANAQQVSDPRKPIELRGLVGVKDTARGTLSVAIKDLHFADAKRNSDLSVASTEDVATGSDSLAAVRETVSKPTSELAKKAAHIALEEFSSTNAQ